jgi:hypothetical protein
MSRTLCVVLLAGLAGLVACGEEERGRPAPSVARAMSTSVCSPLTYSSEGRPR